MATITLRAHGPAVASEVWDRYADTRRWAQWSPQIRSVQATGGPLIEPGLTGQVRSVLGPSVAFEVTEVDVAAMTWRWEVRFGPIRLDLEHSVVIRGAGSATSLVIRGPLPVIAGYAPIAQLALQRLVRS
jgi:hypothetical protein